MAPMAIALLAIAAGALSYALAGAPFRQVKRRAASEAAASRDDAVQRTALQRAGKALERIMPLKLSQARDSRAKLDRAGLAMRPSTWRAAKFAMSAASAVCLAGLGLAFGAGPMFPLLAVPGAALGWLGADAWLDSAGKSRADDVAKNLPSALELMVVSVSAGLVLERGMKDVASDSTFGPVAEEFARCEAEISRLGVPRTRAVAAMRDRCGCPPMSYFCAAVIDATEKGTSIAGVLEDQAAIARKARFDMLAVEAAKLDNKLTVVSFVFFLPATLVLLMAPRIADFWPSFMGIFGAL